MELGVRDWMLIVGSLLILAVLLDGYRRMRQDRRDGLRLPRKTRSRGDIDDDTLNPELPGGGARVVAVRRAEPADGGSLQLDREVPFLMKPLREQPESATAESTDQPLSADAPFDDEDDPLFADPVRVTDDDRYTEPAEAAPEPRKPAAKAKARDADTGAQSKKSPEIQELILLNVMARGDNVIGGSDLLQILLACDVRYGRMNIFHRHELENGQGAEQFSVANLVEPGSFDLDAIEHFSTPGVVFFMHLPGPESPMKAFDAMVETARCLVKNLDLELRDEAHSVATTQTIEHYRQRIRDFERRQLTLV